MAWPMGKLGWGRSPWRCWMGVEVRQWKENGQAWPGGGVLGCLMEMLGSTHEAAVRQGQGCARVREGALVCSCWGRWCGGSLVCRGVGAAAYWGSQQGDAAAAAALICRGALEGEIRVLVEECGGWLGPMRAGDSQGGAPTAWGCDGRLWMEEIGHGRGKPWRLWIKGPLLAAPRGDEVCCGHGARVMKRVVLAQIWDV